MQSVTVLGVSGVELWRVILQSETQAHSTAVLKVDHHMMSTAITVCTTYDVVVVSVYGCKLFIV